MVSWRRLLVQRPGRTPLEERERKSLESGLDADRHAIAGFTVPRHDGTAKAASPGLRLRLGHAALVVPRQELNALGRFVRGTPSPDADDTAGAESSGLTSVLMVSGEPGAGKSVLLQELHQSLALGVVDGQHGLVPLILFARDLSVSLLRSVEVHRQDGMLELIRSLYGGRIERREIDLQSLLDFVGKAFRSCDFLIIIDGLDEIAQRSAYEEIQERLSRLIREDLLGGGSIRRYVLSCRTDENLGLIRGAASLRIPGLSPEMRERFCAELVGESIDRYCLVPGHVFRRNPYFLALLRNHIRAAEERIQPRALDFDYLMRRYLEREVDRTFPQPGGYRTIYERQADFQNYTLVARPGLEWLAFHHASDAGQASLYHDNRIDGELVRGFVEAMESAASARPGGPWHALHVFLRACVGAPRDVELDGGTLNVLGIDKRLSANDIVYLDGVGRRLAAERRAIETRDVHSVFGRLVEASPEPPEFLGRLARALAATGSAVCRTPMESMAFLLFARGVAAAHALRAVTITFDPGGAPLVRFRHRRLAEYFAACYLRARWDELAGRLALSPWLGPVMNLACALEHGQCSTLEWMVRRLETQRMTPAYLWRYAAEETAEATLFADAGPALAALVQRELHVLIAGLPKKKPAHSAAPSLPAGAGPTTAAGKATSASTGSSPGHPDAAAEAPAEEMPSAVTEATILGLLDSLGTLNSALGGDAVAAPDDAAALYAYFEQMPDEWAELRCRAEEAMEKLSVKSAPWQQRGLGMWKAMAEPIGFLGARGSGGSRKLALRRKLAQFSVVTGEACWLGLFASVAFLASLAIAHGVPEGAADLEAQRGLLLGLALFSCAAWRGFAWLSSPTDAAAMATVWWRVTGNLLAVLFVLVALGVVLMAAGAALSLVVAGVGYLLYLVWPVTLVAIGGAGGFFLVRYVWRRPWRHYGRRLAGVAVALIEMFSWGRLKNTAARVAGAFADAFWWIVNTSGSVDAALGNAVHSLSWRRVEGGMWRVLKVLGSPVALLVLVGATALWLAVQRLPSEKADTGFFSQIKAAAASGSARTTAASPDPSNAATGSDRTSALVPPAATEETAAPPREPPFIPEKEWADANRVLCSPLPASPEPGVVGAMIGLLRWRGVTSNLDDLADLRLELRNLSRDSRLRAPFCHVGPISIRRRADLDEAVDERAGALAKLDGTLRERGRGTLVWLGLCVLIASALFFSLRSARARSVLTRDRKKLVGLKGVCALAEFIEDARASERARLEALRRLDEEGVHSDEELATLEYVAGRLAKCHTRSGRAVGLAAARLVRDAGNRLRHRRSVDVQFVHGRDHGGSPL